MRRFVVKGRAREGAVLANSAESLILEALTRAVGASVGVPLLGTKAAPGLFASGAAGKQAAQACKERGFVRVVHTEAKGRATIEYGTLTEEGWAHLLQHTSPRPILETLLARLEASQASTAELAALGRRHEQLLDAIRAALTRLQQQLHDPAPAPVKVNGQAAPQDVIRTRLAGWCEKNPLGDCPLPELYRQARESCPKLTIGRFHDALRQLREQHIIHLHPWTGPMYELPEPALALLVGHEVAYYANLRSQNEG
jgi:hypothetical protein